MRVPGPESLRSAGMPSRSFPSKSSGGVRQHVGEKNAVVALVEDVFGSSTHWQEITERANAFLHHAATEVALALLVLCSLVLLIRTIDLTAPQKYTEGGESIRAPAELIASDLVIAVIFAAEACLRVFVERWSYFTASGTLNFIVAAGDLITSVVEMFYHASLPSVEVFRVFRLTRIMRLSRVVKFFPELGFLLEGIVSAFWTVFWGMVMMMILLLVFSLLAVSVLHPINLKVANNNTYEECGDRCKLAFSSVWNAILTFTQTLLFGDSWGQVALPIIEEESWSILVFLLTLAGIGLAATNLILASIVDSGAQAREAAIQSRSAAARQMEAEEQRRHTAVLLQLCSRIDADESGRLSKQELLEGYARNREFREAIQGMNLVLDDIEVFFDALDRDDSGDVDYEEFLAFMEQSKTADLHQMVVFVKFAVMDLWRMREKDQNRLMSEIRELALLIDKKWVEAAAASTATPNEEAHPAPKDTIPGLRKPAFMERSQLRPSPAGSVESEHESSISFARDAWVPAQPAPVRSASMVTQHKPERGRRPGRSRKRNPGPVESIPSDKFSSPSNPASGGKRDKEPEKEPKTFWDERDALDLNGSWHTLETGPHAQVFTSLEQALNRMGQELGTHTGVLEDIRKCVAEPHWKQTFTGRTVDNPNEGSGFSSRFWSIPGNGMIEAVPETPPECPHGQQPTRRFRVGI